MPVSRPTSAMQEDGLARPGFAARAGDTLKALLDRLFISKGERNGQSGNCLLRGLTLHRPGRRSDGRFVEGIRSQDRIDSPRPFRRRTFRSERGRQTDLQQTRHRAARRTGRSGGNFPKAIWRRVAAAFFRPDYRVFHPRSTRRRTFCIFPLCPSWMNSY